MRHLFSAFGFFLLMALFVACGNEELDGVGDRFIVEGLIVSELGQPIENVLVNSVVDTVLTDAQGRYSVVAYPLGSIEYSKIGFSKLIETIRSRKTIDISLTKIPTGTSTTLTNKTVKHECDNGTILEVPYVEVRDFGEGIGNATFTNNKIWVLKTKVFVNDGQTLTIEPGTIIKGSVGQVETGSALVVARGGKIIANGTSDKPIIFTSEADSISYAADGSICSSSNLSSKDKGLWGGVLLLGKATVNVAGGEAVVDGIPDSEPRAFYGGTDDADNSGSLQYVSIRHGGTELDLTNKMSGLTLAGVGSGTTLEHIEVYSNKHDGFYFLGGTVNTKYLVSSHCGADAFHYSNGWRGLNQYWFAVQDIDAERALHGGGGVKAEGSAPYSTPVVFNATFFGPGTDTGKRALVFENNNGGELHSSIVLAYAFAANIEYLGPSEEDAYNRLITKELVLQRNLFYEVAFQPWFGLSNQSALPNSDLLVVQAIDFVESYFALPENSNRFEDPLLGNFIPIVGGAADSKGSIPEDVFFDFTEFKGSFSPKDPRWTQGWSLTDKEL